MGIFSKIGEKLKNVVGAIKNTVVYKKVDTSKTMINKGGNIMSVDQSVKEKKSQIARESREHFELSFKNKSIDDIIAYISGENLIKNFSNSSEIKRMKRDIADANREISHDDSLNERTLDNLYGFMAGGQKPNGEAFTEDEVATYSRIAENCQARSRALSFVKANFAAIVNKVDFTKEEDRKSFDRLMEVVKDYCKVANNFSVAEFSAAQINPSLVAKDSSNLKNASKLAQTKTDEIVIDRIQKESDTAFSIAIFANGDKTSDTKGVIDYVKEYDEKIQAGKELTKNINDLEEGKKHLAQENKLYAAGQAFLDAQEEIDPYSKEDTLRSQTWAKHFGLNKKIRERQGDFLAQFYEIAKNTKLFTVDDNLVVRDINGNEIPVTLDENGKASVGNFELDMFSNGKTPDTRSNLEKLMDAIQSYNSNPEIQNRPGTLKVKRDAGKGEDGLIYTGRQERIMESVFLKMRDYAIEHLDDADCVSPLDDFSFKTVIRSLKTKQTTNIYKAIFEAHAKDLKNFTFSNLSTAEMKDLYDFINENQSVGINARKELQDWAIDNELIESFTIQKKNNKLNSIVDYMKDAAVNANNNRIRNRQDENNQLAEELNAEQTEKTTEREQTYAGLTEVKKALEEMLPKVEAIKVPAKVKGVKNQNSKSKKELTSLIKAILSDIEKIMPKSAEEIVADTKEIEQGETTYTDKLEKLVEEINSYNTQVLDDLAKLTSQDRKERAEARTRIYKDYLSAEDQKNLKKFMNKVVEDIKEIDSSALANDETERE